MSDEFLDAVARFKAKRQRREQSSGPITGLRPYVAKAVADECAKLADSPPGRRNDALNRAAFALYGFTQAGEVDEATIRSHLHHAAKVNGLIDDDGEAAFRATVDSGFRASREKIGERTVPERTPDVLEIPAANLDAPSLEAIEENFWDAREHLRLIYDAALSQMMSPWAVLCCVVARLLVLTPPTLRLPAIIGGEGSLNWNGAITAKSGGGKGGAMAVAALLVPFDDVYIRGAGSGEGMIEAYKRASETPIQSILFSIDEVDSLASLRDRSGQTTMAVIRSGFSGETLGYSYRGRAGELVAAHTYRMVMLVSVQPARAGALFDDGGTPQRFQWFAGRDRRIQASVDAQWPKTRHGEPAHIPLLSARDLADVGIIDVPQIVWDTVRAARAASMAGDDDALDGHALYCQEKFAVALALMDGRTQMNADDWKLAGIAANVSAWTRDAVQRKMAEALAQRARERGELMGITRASAEVAQQVEQQQANDRVLRWIVGKLEKRGQLKRSDLHKLLASRDRRHFAGALGYGIAMGVLTCDADGVVNLK